MVTIQTEAELAIAHRLASHKGKCHNLHGHNYKFIVEIGSAMGLNDQGMIMDFAELKKALEDLKRAYDHKTVIHAQDSRCRLLDSVDTEDIVSVSYIPTAENMIEAFVTFLNMALPNQVYVESAKLYETEKCCAIYRRKPSVSAL